MNGIIPEIYVSFRWIILNWPLKNSKIPLKILTISRSQNFVKLMGHFYNLRRKNGLFGLLYVLGEKKLRRFLNNWGHLNF